jgi:flagella basal body P-ring formation protein FlgA
MKIAAILVIVAGLARAACIDVPADKIVARDLSTAVPLFQALDPEKVIGFAPLPGTVRTLTSRDILLVARRNALTFSIGDAAPSVCVQRIAHPLSPQDVRAALISALNVPAAHLDVLEFSNKLVPPGRLVFQLAALNKPAANNPQAEVIWPGKLLFDAQNSLDVWAKVRISVDREIFLAKEAIPRGAVIGAAQISTVRMAQFPFPEPPLSSLSAIVDKVARRAMVAGQRIVPEALDDPQDVLRGETVHVTVINGAATITLDAVAQSSGTKGESILVHNPSSGRTFHALIEERGRVKVVPPTESAL